MKYLISIYCWLILIPYFVGFLITGLILSFLFPPQIYDPWLKFLLRFLFKLMFIRVEVEGTEYIKSGKIYLFMANHTSIFDIPILGGFIPTFVRGIEAKRQFKWPLYGWAIRRLGNIPIERKSVHNSIKSINIAAKKIQNGLSIVVLPEGHRTLDGKLRQFKKLPFYLAKQAKVDIIPLGISGFFTLNRKGTYLITPTPVKIKFGEPISHEKIEKLSEVEIRDIVKEKIQNLIEFT